jgi:hypothetical protein
MIRILRVLTICLAAVATTPAVANLIVNGSFETPVVPAGSTLNFPGGSTGITGWTMVGVDSDLISTSFTQSGVTFNAQDGQQWIDLAGHTSNSQTSGATQSITTVAGGLYAVSFYVGSADDNVNNFFFPSTIDLSINGGPRVHFTNPIAPSNHLDWAQFVVPFVATGSSTNLTFYNGGASNNFLSALDNVVVDAVPEPSSVVLIGLGVVGFLGRRRIRR